MKLSLLLEKLLFLREANEGKSGSESIEIVIGKDAEDSLFEIEIKEVCEHSAKASRASVFVCIKGEKHDGNDFLDEAKKCGARVFVSENPNTVIDTGILIITNNARKTMAEMSKIVYGFDKTKIITVGITGTKGKSTVAEILAQGLKAMGIKTLSVTTLGITDNEFTESANTTPTSPILYSTLGCAVKDGARVAVIELSSQALKDFRAYGIDFDIVAFTSFGVDHVGKGEHKNLASYISSKRKLFTSYGAKVAVVNYDDPFSSYMSAGVKRVVRCGSFPCSDYRISNIESDFFETKFKLSDFNTRTSLPGEYNAMNFTLAVAIAKEITYFPLKFIAEKFAPIKVEGRFEVYFVDSRIAIIDYAHNKKSFEAIMGFVSKKAKGRLIAVFGSVGERSERRRYELAEVAERYADISIICEDNPKSEESYKIAKEIYDSFKDNSRVFIILKRAEAIRRAFEISKPDDVILLLGKGHERYIEKEGKRIYFSERDLLSKINREKNRN